MTREQFCTKFANRVCELIPDIPRAPIAVKQVYETAVGHFGEDSVDLQKNNQIEYWKDVLDISFFELGKSCGITVAQLSTLSFRTAGMTMGSFEAESEAHIDEFLQLITPEGILHSNWALYRILVHFHNITVSNTRGESTLIEDIYASIPVKVNGRNGRRMTWLRTTTSALHRANGYRHSHLRSLHSDWTLWLRPCLGTGPINMTIDSLSQGFDEELWMLFWLELDMCIRVESIEGGPYIYMRNIVSNSRVTDIYDDFVYIGTQHYNILNRFRKVFSSLVLNIIHSGQLKFSFDCDKIIMINPFIDFSVLASNCFLGSIRSYSQGAYLSLISSLINAKFAYYGQITTDRKILSYGQVAPEAQTIPDTEAGFSFKGAPVTYRVLPSASDERTVLYFLLAPAFVSYLKAKIIDLANNIYARNQQRKKA